MKHLFDIQHTTMVDTGTSAQLVQKMIVSCDCDLFFERVSLSLDKDRYSIQHIAEKIKSFIQNGRAVMPFDEHSVVITGGFEYKGGGELRRAANFRQQEEPELANLAISGDHQDNPVLIWIAIGRDQSILDLKVDITAGAEAVLDLKEKISKAFEEDNMAQIKWWYSGHHGENTRSIYLPAKDNEYKIHPEFYPDLGDPEKYLDDYMNSNEAVLLMAGPPGTGKTTMLRHLVIKYKLCAHLIYDERIMEKDGVFQSFLFDDKGDLMIIEDADTILSTRERDGNKLMSRFLNVSDGLIKLPNKKLIFTTNIVDFNNVDQALLRPGRCFGVMHTRPLNLAEAQAAAKVGGLPIPTERKEYTLAQLFNQGKREIVRTMGFGVRH